jgi:hypothetical protein
MKTNVKGSEHLPPIFLHKDRRKTPIKSDNLPKPSKNRYTKKRKLVENFIRYTS